MHLTKITEYLLNNILCKYIIPIESSIPFVIRISFTLWSAAFFWIIWLVIIDKRKLAFLGLSKSWLDRPIFLHESPCIKWGFSTNFFLWRRNCKWLMGLFCFRLPSALHPIFSTLGIRTKLPLSIFVRILLWNEQSLCFIIITACRSTVVRIQPI